MTFRFFRSNLFTLLRGTLIRTVVRYRSALTFLRRCVVRNLGYHTHTDGPLNPRTDSLIGRILAKGTWSFNDERLFT